MRSVKKIYFFLFPLLLLPKLTFAQILSGGVEGKRDDNERDFMAGAGVENGTIPVGKMAEVVISAFLSVLGVIFIVLIIIAGYNWMTAAGDESKVTKAKSTLLRAVIGLLIIAGAYTITYFVFSSLPGSSGVGGVGGGGGAPLGS